jgi:hypothetical protein
MAKSEGVQDPPASLREALRAGLNPGVCRICQFRYRVMKEARSADRIIAWEPVGFWSPFRPEGPWEGDFGPNGLGNLAQALAWVALQ